MNREITMESVFLAGFKAAYTLHLNWCLNVYDEPEGDTYFESRNKAWLDYVKSLETPNG